MIRHRKVNKPTPVMGATARALYQIKGNGMYLHANSDYTIHVNLSGISNTYSFTSSYSPVYVNPKDVRIDLGTMLNKFSDADLWHIIRNNTVYLQDNISDDYVMQTAEAPDNVMKEWVKIQSQIDAIYGAYTSIAGNLGSEAHNLGYLSISKSNKLPYLDDLLKKLNQDLISSEVLLFGLSVSSAVKGGTSYPHPIAARNSF